MRHCVRTARRFRAGTAGVCALRAVRGAAPASTGSAAGSLSDGAPASSAAQSSCGVPLPPSRSHRRPLSCFSSSVLWGVGALASRAASVEMPPATKGWAGRPSRPAPPPPSPYRKSEEWGPPCGCPLPPSTPPPPHSPPLPCCTSMPGGSCSPAWGGEGGCVNLGPAMRHLKVDAMYAPYAICCCIA